MTRKRRQFEENFANNYTGSCQNDNLWWWPIAIFGRMTAFTFPLIFIIQAKRSQFKASRNSITVRLFERQGMSTHRLLDCFVQHLSDINLRTKVKWWVCIAGESTRHWWILITKGHSWGRSRYYTAVHRIIASAVSHPDDLARGYIYPDLRFNASSFT